MEHHIIESIYKFVDDFQTREDIETTYREPVIGFADAKDKGFNNLKEVIDRDYMLPTDFVEDAKTVIVFFIPFSENIINSNKNETKSSYQWARAYYETNLLINELSRLLVKEIEKNGLKAGTASATHNFDKKRLISFWSHRHAAELAGIGRMGLNNMLITEKGCCGRVGSVITNLNIEPTPCIHKEYCLYKIDDSLCGICSKKCINNALDTESFNRFKCYDACLSNVGQYSDIIGITDVCGKCCVGLPCSINIPKFKAKRESAI